MRIVYLPLYAELEPFISHKEAQRQYCFLNLLDRVYWIAGSSLSEARFDSDTRTLSLPIVESFENIFSKSLMALEWLLKYDDFDYVVRTNTSTFFDERRIKLLIEELGTPKALAAGEFGYSELNAKTSENSGIFLAGTAILLSRKVVEKLVKIDMNEWTEWPDDVAISHILSEQGNKFERIKRNDITDYKPFLISNHYRVKSWTNNQITSERFENLHEILHSKKYKRFLKVSKFHFLEFTRYSKDFPIHQGLNIARWLRQIVRYLKLDTKTWMWILGADD